MKIHGVLLRPHRRDEHHVSSAFWRYENGDFTEEPGFGVDGRTHVLDVPRARAHRPGYLFVIDDSASHRWAPSGDGVVHFQSSVEIAAGEDGGTVDLFGARETKQLAVGRPRDYVGMTVLGRASDYYVLGGAFARPRTRVAVRSDGLFQVTVRWALERDGQEVGWSWDQEIEVRLV